MWVHDYQMQLVPAMLRAAAARSADRLLPAHPVPARPSCSSSCRGGASCSRGCSAPTWSGSSCPAAPRTSCGWSASGSGTRPTATWSTCPTGAPCAPRRSRSPSTPRASRSWPAPRRSRRRAEEIRERAGRPAQDLPRCRPARLHQGHLRPAARLRRADRRRATSTSRTPSSCRWRCPRASRWSSTSILRDEIDRLVGRINGDLGRIGRPAISYLHSSYPREEMAALYRAADIMVVTPLPRRDEPGRQGVRRLPLRRRRAPWCSRSSPGPPTSCGRRGWSTPTTSTA